MDIKVVIDKGAYMPEYAHKTDAGADLRSPVNTIVPANGSVVIDTGVHMKIPDGYVGMIKSKSGLNVKHDITNEGVIDADYTGSIALKLYNNGKNDYRIMKGDKISQIVILPVCHGTFQKVDNLEKTERGNNGFGSTGR